MRNKLLLICIFMFVNFIIVPTSVLAKTQELNRDDAIEVLSKALREVIAKQQAIEREIQQIKSSKNTSNKSVVLKNKTKYMIVTHKANVRAKPSLNSKIIQVISVGDLLDLKKANYDWYITKQGFYISRHVVKKVNPFDFIELSPMEGKNIRKSPVAIGSENILRTAKKNEKIKVYRTRVLNNNWYMTEKGFFIFR